MTCFLFGELLLSAWETVACKEPASLHQVKNRSVGALSPSDWQHDTEHLLQACPPQTRQPRASVLATMYEAD